MPEKLTSKMMQTMRELEAKATKGLWTSSREDMDSYTGNSKGETVPVAYIYRKPEERIGILGAAFRHDSRFIAHARTFVPLALDEIDRLNAEVAKARIAGLREAAKLACSFHSDSPSHLSVCRAYEIYGFIATLEKQQPPHVHEG